MLQRGSKTRMLLTSLALAWALAIIAAAGNASAGKSSSPLGMAAVAFVVIIALRLAYRRIARPRGGR